MYIAEFNAQIDQLVVDWREHGIAAATSSSSSSPVPLDRIIQKITYARDTMLRNCDEADSTEATADFNCLFHFHKYLKQSAGPMYPHIVDLLPPHLVILVKPSLTQPLPPPTPSTTPVLLPQPTLPQQYQQTKEWIQFVEMIRVFQKKVMWNHVLIFQQAGDLDILFAAKRLQIETQSDSLWPFLYDAFAGNTNAFLHYAVVFSEIFMYIEGKYGPDRFVRQSVPFDLAEFHPEPITEEETPAPLLPAPAPPQPTESHSSEEDDEINNNVKYKEPKTTKKRKAATAAPKKIVAKRRTIDTSLIGKALPENMLVKGSIEEGTSLPSLSSFIYESETQPVDPVFVYLSPNATKSELAFYENNNRRIPLKKTIHTPNKVLDSAADLEKQQNDLMDHCRSRLAQLYPEEFTAAANRDEEEEEHGGSGGSGGDDTRVGNSRTEYIVDPTILATICKTLAERYTCTKFSVDALRILSDGIQTHMKNVVESILRVADNTANEARFNPDTASLARIQEQDDIREVAKLTWEELEQEKKTVRVDDKMKLAEIGIWQSIALAQSKLGAGEAKRRKLQEAGASAVTKNRKLHVGFNQAMFVMEKLPTFHSLPAVVRHRIRWGKCKPMSWEQICRAEQAIQSSL